MGTGATNCFFVSDLHGHRDRYRKLFAAIAAERPTGVFFGGDLLPGAEVHGNNQDFINDFLVSELGKLREALGSDYPEVFVILGNDDGRYREAALLDVATRGIWDYVHFRRVDWRKFSVYGYCYVPPTPFMLKDWERFDVSRYVDPGCLAPEHGSRSIAVSDYELRYATIAEDLQRLVNSDDLRRSIFLFHAPPYRSRLDRAALDGKTINHVPLDVHVGSIAIDRFIKKHQPLITLHGHVHESARLTGHWHERIGRTHAFSAAHDGPELALVRFDPDDPAQATRELVR